MEVVLSEFSTLASVVDQLLQRLVRDFQATAAKVCAERAQYEVLVELLWESGERRGKTRRSENYGCCVRIISQLEIGGGHAESPTCGRHGRGEAEVC